MAMRDVSRMRPSEREAVSALERVINDAKNEGFAYALSCVERELLSADSIDEVLAWLTRARGVARRDA